MSGGAGVLAHMRPPRGRPCACGCGVFRLGLDGEGYHCAQCGAPRVERRAQLMLCCTCGSFFFLVSKAGFTCQACGSETAFSVLADAPE